MPWFSLPMFALAGALAALGVAAAHLISSRTRAPRPLPTVRFIASAQQRSAAVERRPRDIALLLLRASALLAAGLALAGPRLPAGTDGTTEVVIADFTNTASRAAVRDSAVAAAGDGFVVPAGGPGMVAVDELARESAEDAEHSGGALTAGIVSALRGAAELTAAGSVVRLSIVSSFTRSSIDSATLAVRSLWPGRVRLIPVAADSVAPATATIEFRGEQSDPLRQGVLRAGRASASPVVILRDGISSADSVAARQGAVVVNWPRSGVAGSSGAPTSDTVAGVWLGGYTWIAPLLRYVPADSLAAQTARVPARWLDGTAAVVEHVVGEGCVRDVGIGVPDVGDLVISQGFAQLLATLSEPCGGARAATPLTAGELRLLSGEGPEAATIRAAGVAGESAVARVLLVLAMAAVLGELLLRRRA